MPLTTGSEGLWAAAETEATTRSDRARVITMEWMRPDNVIRTALSPRTISFDDASRALGSRGTGGGRVCFPSVLAHGASQNRPAAGDGVLARGGGFDVLGADGAGRCARPRRTAHARPVQRAILRDLRRRRRPL